ncbi:hypothetical protein ACIGBH_26335 [Streptomyces sp. NPDC085929]|uniref:hypothetical protein n=1 Tax=Streptomyces sp. NPDC085929 TaxID=3365739 RepID=UPI0037D6CF78
MRGLRGKNNEKADVLAGLADRGIRVRERSLLLRHHPPPRVEKIPHGAGSVSLVIRLANLGRKQCKLGAMPELPLLENQQRPV